MSNRLSGFLVNTIRIGIFSFYKSFFNGKLFSYGEISTIIVYFNDHQTFTGHTNVPMVDKT